MLYYLIFANINTRILRILFVWCLQYFLKRVLSCPSWNNAHSNLIIWIKDFNLIFCVGALELLWGRRDCTLGIVSKLIWRNWSFFQEISEFCEAIQCVWRHKVRDLICVASLLILQPYRCSVFIFLCCLLNMLRIHLFCSWRKTFSRVIYFELFLNNSKTSVVFICQCADWKFCLIESSNNRRSVVTAVWGEQML